MNVIDALVVVLGLDSKELDSKAPGAAKKLDQLEKKADTTEKSVGKISKTSKETARSVEGLSRTVTGFLAIIGGTVAIKNFIQDFIDTNAQLDRLSKNLGVGVSTISAWSNASERLGGSAQGLQGTFDMLSKAQTQLMITGESSLVPYLSALGVSLAGVNGQARPVTDILLDLSERFSRMDRTTANNLGRMLGIDQGTMNLLLQGRKELELEISRQKEQTAVTAAQAAQAQKFQTQIAGIKQQFMALGRTLLSDAAPYIEKTFNILERFGAWAQEHEQFIEDFFKVIAIGLGAIALATAPINLTVAAVVALAAGIALLWDDYQTWKKGGDSLIDWSKWEPGIDSATKAIQFLTNALSDLIATYKRWFVATGDFGAGVDTIKGWLGIKSDAPKSGGKLSSILKPFGGGGSGTNPLVNAIAHQEGFYASGSPNRPQRNHNPGNIKDGKFARSHGAVGNDGPFAIFPSDEIGMAALTALLNSPSYAGLSIDQAITKYAPPNENDTSGYIAGVKKFLGGSYASSMMGVPGAAGIVQNVPAAAGGGATTIDRSIKTDIGTVVVNTQATDAAGMVADMDHAFDYLFASQANYGMN